VNVVGDCTCDQFYRVKVCTERDEDCAEMTLCKKAISVSIGATSWQTSQCQLRSVVQFLYIVVACRCAAVPFPFRWSTVVGLVVVGRGARVVWLEPNSTTRTPATNTSYEHRQRKKNLRSQHLDMSRCWALALRCGKFVVELL